ncbi:hypothetical protein PVAP13_3KG468401, partial [Panicum virgatum]
MSEPQRKMIRDINFGGLLNIPCPTIPAEFANWLFVECFDPKASELVFPGRGRILITPDSVARIFNLPNKGGKVMYELDVDAINSIQSKYDTIQGSAPKIEQIMEMLKNSKTADEDYMRGWLMIAISAFLCPPTSLGISPRCYPALVDLSAVKKLNWCEFVVNQLKDAAIKINKKNSVREETARASTSRPKRMRVLKHDDEEEESEDPDYKEDETEEESEDSYYSEEDGMEDNSDDGSTGPPPEDEPAGVDAPRDAPYIEENEDLVPLSTRLKRFQSIATKNVQGSSAAAPQGIDECLPPEKSPVVQKLGNIDARHARLKLLDIPTSAAKADKNNVATDKGCNSKESVPTVSKHHIATPRTNAVQDDKNNNTTKQSSSTPGMDKARANVVLESASNSKVRPWDFPIDVPEFDIMKSIEEATPLETCPPTPPTGKTDSRWTLDGLPNEEYLLWEAEAIRVHEQAKPKQHKGSTSNSQSIEDPTNNKCYNPISAPSNKLTMHAAPTPQATGITAAASVEGDSSITPLCVPPPRRAFKLGAALQSPYILIEPRRMPFKCSKEVCKVYDAVCMFARRSTRSKSSEQPIINYIFNFASLGHLADSVKPGGKLKNTIAEIGIYVINGKKKRGATRQVLPLHVSTFLQHNQSGMAAVTQILFPVLQKLVQSDEHSGHYFLIVLNLRNKRFEVLDSMRNLENGKLAECCNKITNAIKSLHDCGFHMLMNAEYCDGRTVCNIQEGDMPRIRKILTHKWVTYDENDTDWEEMLNLEMTLK